MPPQGEWEHQSTDIINDAPATVPTSGWSAASMAPFGTGSGFGAPFPIATNWPASTGIWLRRTVTLPSGGPLTIHGHVENSSYIYVARALVHSVNTGNPQGTRSEGGRVGKGC